MQGVSDDRAFHKKSLMIVIIGPGVLSTIAPSTADHIRVLDGTYQGGYIFDR
jgi:hypothetical protein